MNKDLYIMQVREATDLWLLFLLVFVKDWSA